MSDEMSLVFWNLWPSQGGLGHASPSLDLTLPALRTGEAPWSCLAAAWMDELVGKVFQIILCLSENSSTKPSV